MNGLGMLYCWHDRGLMVAISLSSPDKLFSGCPKQSERGFIRENNLTPVLSSPIPVPFAEYQYVPDVFPGEKWLLCLTPGYPPKVFTSLCVQMHSHLPAAIRDQALCWWCPDPATESTLGDGPGACWTFLGALKPSSQQLKVLMIR